MMAQNPILISIPHSAVNFPAEVRDSYLDEVLNRPEDTDWFVEKLYDFAPGLEIEVVVAPYSRYLIDLNRDPMMGALYDDGRSETSLTPTTTFLGAPIIKDQKVSQSEIKRRLEKYYWPYYKELEEKLQLRVEKFGQALLFDAHSIKRNVSTIRKEPFPDMILGDADETSASALIIDTALNTLGAGQFQVNHNNPFKGGHITRYFGNIEKGIHALQLEMSQDLYMDESTITYDAVKAEKVRDLLKSFFKEMLLLLE